MFQKIPFVSALFTQLSRQSCHSEPWWQQYLLGCPCSDPIMRRFQELELARDSVSVDSTASCDATDAPSQWCYPCRSTDPQRVEQQWLPGNIQAPQRHPHPLCFGGQPCYHAGPCVWAGPCAEWRQCSWAYVTFN